MVIEIENGCLIYEDRQQVPWLEHISFKQVSDLKDIKSVGAFLSQPTCSRKLRKNVLGKLLSVSGARLFNVRAFHTCMSRFPTLDFAFVICCLASVRQAAFGIR